MSKIHQMTIVLCNSSGSEAIYWDGSLKMSGDNVYPCDIAEVAKGRAFTLTHEDMDESPEDWPGTLDELFGKEDTQ
jgi:hypothetical protein